MSNITLYFDGGTLLCTLMSNITLYFDGAHYSVR